VDPRLDSRVTGIWGIANGAGSTDALVQAGLVYTALQGYSKCARINLGGYDYHNNTRTTGDTKDQQAGTLVGKILATAQALGKPCFVFVTSDGSVESADSAMVGTAWRSDRGDAGMAFIFAYDPNGRPVTLNRAEGFGLAHQIGWFTSEQAAARTGFVAGWNDEKAAAAAFANYLKFANRWDLYSPVMCQFGQNTTEYFSATDLDRILKLGAT
jgi:hypothetical protein